MNRDQQYMKQALDDIDGVKPELREDYGRLCHQVPALVLTNGLAVTAAYLASKARESEIHAIAVSHLRGVLGATQSLPAHLAARGTGGYMEDTFTVLDAWVFYKRFAESILGVAPGDTPEPAAGTRGEGRNDA